MLQYISEYARQARIETNENQTVTPLTCSLIQYQNDPKVIQIKFQAGKQQRKALIAPPGPAMAGKPSHCGSTRAHSNWTTSNPYKPPADHASNALGPLRSAAEVAGTVPLGTTPSDSNPDNPAAPGACISFGQSCIAPPRTRKATIEIVEIPSMGQKQNNNNSSKSSFHLDWRRSGTA